MLKEIKDKSLELAENSADTVISTVTSRFKNPFVASFCLSWILWNWHAIIFLIFSSQAIECKFPYIEKYFYTWEGYNWDYYPYFIKCLVLPLFSALFYIIALPYLDNLFTKINKKAYEKKREDFEAEDLVIITHEENKKQRIFEIQNKEAESTKLKGLQEQIIEQNKEISDLRAYNEKTRRSFIEENTALQSGYEDQIKQLRDTINDQGRTINNITHDSENIRKESNDRLVLLSDSNTQLNDALISLNTNSELAVKLIDRILTESRFIDEAYIAQLHSESSNWIADQDFVMRIKELLNKKGKPDLFLSYFVFLEHDAIQSPIVGQTIKQIFQLLGGYRRVTTENRYTKFVFDSNNKINVDLLASTLSGYPNILLANVQQYGRMVNDEHYKHMGY
ncbi:MAG: hypothetical protein LBE37_17960 [Sphingobacterium sp.]|jgi:hypothetical protein|nr:hypothetical protein [Sphingobacterium sp.]